ncbi:protein-disulfide reductase DsbD domain-containing protein [Rubrivirga sp. IMCC45206]|uniref:protein-disulfide reductase DsbD domain-containing protein n=1 Tax=Rubrivirga sp. IMCC45206 TaxID=3391614 RepID=UPI00398FAAFB
MHRLLFLLAFLTAAPALAQAPRTEEVVSWRARAETASPGAQARVVLDATIAPGWRLYALGSTVGIPLVVSLDALPDGIRAVRLAQSEPREGYDEAFASAYPYFAESARVVQVLGVGRRLRPGRREVSGTVRFAVCDDRICLPPASVPFRVPLVIE